MTFTDPAQSISAERLTLEPLRIDHCNEMVSVLADDALYTYTGGEAPSLADVTRRYTALVAGSDDPTEQWHNWILRLRDSDEAIGYVQATVYADSSELAWVIGTNWQGHGYAQESAHAMKRWLGAQGVSVFHAWIHADHTVSQKVAQRIDMACTDEVDDDGEQRWSTNQ